MPTVIGQGTGPGEVGVLGESKEAEGVRGIGHKGAGVSGTSEKWLGVYGESQEADGVRGVGHQGAGVSGTSEKGIGVYGESQEFIGVSGVGHQGAGVSGISEKWIGVYGKGMIHEGVVGETESPNTAAIAGVSLNPVGTGAGVYGESRGKGPAFYGRGPFAAFLDGDVVVSGSLSVKGDVTLANADCAENFELEPTALTTEAGMVLTIGSEGRLKPCAAAYDTRVAGVISGAGSYRPAIILNKEPGIDTGVPVALVGRVCCFVDATYAPIEAGDLLTTSETPGHAMKATELSRALGAIVGKALAPLPGGRGLIPVLIVMQ